ncbi:hypothetical protein [Parasitella parasitica]|uniref:Uncharacterized protein n=1 Tax=Parasitella parasitica TaxID=35722 RepID=A0A0B7NFM7_9FUNG|nr:hypothetical protein [Parasitella parasitica]
MNNNVVFYSACDEPGHSRRTFRGCRLNPRNQRATNNEGVEDDGIEMSETSSNRMDSFQTSRNPKSVPTARDDRGSMNCVSPRCFAWMWIEKRIAASSKINPRFQLCCGKGKYIIQPSSSTPVLIYIKIKTFESLFQRKTACGSTIRFQSVAEP